MSDELIAMPQAIADFHRARRRAAIQELIACLKGEPVGLLSYEEVRQRLNLRSQREKGLADVPLDAIVGSVDRYTDFTRGFLPRAEVDPQRWARVKMQTTGLVGLPPIEVYKIGDAYFVKDGNHRVSVARELGATHIQAYVTEIQTGVSLEPDVSPDDLILKEEYADFLSWSHLHEVLPDVDLILTAPGKYEDLKEHISVHRYYMGIEQDRPIPLEEAVVDWYEAVYRPIVETIERLGVLRDFPDRTETDLYLWIAEHRAALQEALGWHVEPDAAAEDLIAEFSSKPERILARVTDRIFQAATLEKLGLATPQTGEWRARRVLRQGRDPAHLFHNILVTLDGEPLGWQALDAALELARREHGRILALHVVADEEEAESEAVQELRHVFEGRCETSEIPGELAIGTGAIARQITMRARWADLVVAPLHCPPGPDPVEKLRSGFRTMIVRSPCPVLAVPAPLFPLSSAVLAYDGSPKGREALFVATYMAASWPELSLVVVSSHPDQDFVKRNLEEARVYLGTHDLEAEMVGRDEADAAAVIREVAEVHDSSLIVMGGYGSSPVVELMLGSAVNEILRTAGRATLICR